MRKKIKYIQEVKKIAQAQIQGRIRLETSEFEIKNIRNDNLKILLSNLTGTRYNKDVLGLGTELSNENDDNFGNKLSDTSVNESDLSFRIIIQV